MGIIYFIIALEVIIIVHEFGHYIAAKLFGIRVNIFNIGIGKTIYSYSKNGLNFNVGLLPIGGFLKLDEKQYVECKYYQKIILLMSGPMINYLLSIIIFTSILFLRGIPQVNEYPLTVGSVAPNGIGVQLGLSPGDEIMSVNGKKILTWAEFRSSINNLERMTLEVTRNQKKMVLSSVVPVTPISMLGINKKVSTTFERKRGMESLLAGCNHFCQLTLGIFETIKDSVISLPELSFEKLSSGNISGPIETAKIANKEYKIGFANFMYFIGVLSIGIGCFNLIPIPLFDGGNIALHTVEKIMGKRFSEESICKIYKFSFFIIGLLFTHIIYFDFIKLSK